MKAEDRELARQRAKKSLQKGVLEQCPSKSTTRRCVLLGKGRRSKKISYPSRRIIKEHCLLKQVKKCQKLKLINTPSLVLKTSGDDDVPRATAGTRVITVIKVKDKNGHVRLKKLNVKRIRQKTPLPQ
ncbi:hypothetical protein RirG_039250 [Rhizophagus irregularis DAOM 197198w]|uniref:Uncharacterized protein n=1 Tax=Rhizophagus irregularis (strain DAOM 197198w) TaxID=1432141 RepID=A0A015N9A0_RHIIW|nr:hypothetical protein RirG_039250 [Rhizophagus irregularis DAOM 197198w]